VFGELYIVKEAYRLSMDDSLEGTSPFF